MSLPRYPKYKASGVEWLGEVPEHWTLDRIKRSTLSCQNGIWGDEPQQNENDIPCVRVADFDRQKHRVDLGEPTIRNVTFKERAGRVLSKGDLLLEKSGGGETQPVGCVVLYDHDIPAVCSNFVARVKIAPRMDASFWRYVHAAAYSVRLNTRSIKQTSGIQNLDASQYLDEKASFPPLAEQTQIAEFLDRETAKIDELVGEQRRLMELLKEKRQAVISHAVTQGLNPNAPMKPSGIEWLGDVPAHWCVVPMKRIMEVRDGTHATPAYVDPADDSFPLITSKDFGETAICFDDAKHICANDHYEIIRRSNTAKGDVLMSMIGGNIGKALIVKADREFSIKNVALFKTNSSEALARYVLYYLQSGLLDVQIDLLSRGGAQGFLGLGDIRNLVFFKVPQDQLEEVVMFLDQEADRLDALIAEAQRAIDLLQERRTALISAAVTGQIDVRTSTQKKAA